MICEVDSPQLGPSAVGVLSGNKSIAAMLPASIVQMSGEFINSVILHRRICLERGRE